MNRLTVFDFSRLSDVELYTTAELWNSAECQTPHPSSVVCLSCRIREEVTELTMLELRARSGGLVPHRTVSLPQDDAL
jgi:hypothetical protein